MYNCKNCESLLREGVKFCSKCGTSVVDPDAVARLITESNLDQEVLFKKTWLDFQPLLILYSSILFIIFISSVSRQTHPLFNVTIWAILAGLTCYFSVFYKSYLSELFKLHKFSFKVSIEIIILSVVVFLFMKAYFYSFEIMHFETVKITTFVKKYQWPVWSAFVLISACPGILEEIIFRGIIYTKLKDIFDTKEALIIQAACFSVLHLSPLIFISHFVMGLFFGWVRERTKTLYFSMLFHMAWNAYVVLVELRKIN